MFVINAAQAKAQSSGSLFQVEDTPSPSRNDFFSAIIGEAENDIWAVGSVSLHFDGSTWTAFRTSPVARPLKPRVGEETRLIIPARWVTRAREDSKLLVTELVDLRQGRLLWIESLDRRRV